MADALEGVSWKPPHKAKTSGRFGSPFHTACILMRTISKGGLHYYEDIDKERNHRNSGRHL